MQMTLLNRQTMHRSVHAAAFVAPAQAEMSVPAA